MKKKFDLLKEKFDLPDFESLNRDFEISSIDDEDILREICKKMVNTGDFYINFLEDIIQPDSRFYTLKEANFLDKNHRVLVNDIYSKLVYFNRLSIELHLDYSQESAVSFIKAFFVEWQLLKKKLLPIIKILKDSWSKKTEIKVDGGYFG